jgi:hypothetical protein
MNNYRFCKHPPLGRILIQLNPLYTTRTNFFFLRFRWYYVTNAQFFTVISLLLFILQNDVCIPVIPVPAICSVRLMSLTWAFEVYMSKSVCYEAPFYAVFSIVLPVRLIQIFFWAPCSIQWFPGALSPGVKRLGREVDHSPPTTAEVKKMWIHTSTPPYALVA